VSVLHVELTPSAGTTRVALTGDLTEHADFAAVRALESPEIVFDLRAVRRINSCGVREWIRLMEALRAARCALLLEHCSVPFVNQMNMIVNFVGDARVGSFYAPYLCERCDHEYVEFCELPAGGVPALRESTPCPRCGEAAPFDDIPDAYLLFVRSSRTPRDRAP